MKGFEIVPYTAHDFPAFEKHIGRIFHPKYILTDRRYIDWQFDRIMLVKVGMDVVGHCGYKDVPFVIDGTRETVRVVMNLQLAREYHAFGIGTLLVQSIVDTSHHLFVAMFKEAATNLLHHLRSTWREVGNLRRYMAIFQPTHPLFDALLVRELQSREPNKWDSNGRVAVQKITTELGTEHDIFWQGIRTRHGVTVERTSEYLTWRFIKHPFFDYNVYEARNDEKVAGLAFWRTEICGDFKIARLIDFVAEASVERVLLDAFREGAELSGAHAADFFCSGSVYHESLKATGFFDVEGTDLTKFPIHFNPISYGKRSINIGHDFKTAFADCYFTKEIGDIDRPNPH